MAEKKNGQILTNYSHQKLNYAGFVVIGAGLPRTATSSLREALGLLLDGACYHMFSVFSSKATDPDVNFWNKAVKTKPRKIEWINFFEGRGYRAGVDYPVSKFYKEIMEAYPNAKVILTVRDPVRWYNSVKNSIYRTRGLQKDPLVRWFGKLLMRFTGDADGMDCSLNVTKELFDTIEEGEEASVKFYNDWVESVKNHVPKEKLLVFEAKEGWEPLCEFLNLPKPEIPFPNINDTASINKSISAMKTSARLFFLVLPAALAAIGAFIYTKMR